MNIHKISLILFLFIASVIAPLLFAPYEGYTNYKLDRAMGDFPNSQVQVLVEDTYPRIPVKDAPKTNDTAAIWQDYPVYPLGSYEQVTNNLRYPDNPDNGSCTPASMCNVLYENKYLGSNIVTPLPPVPENGGTRVGYFLTA